MSATVPGTTATEPFNALHDAINGALDAIVNLPDEAHGRETGQVELKLNEAKLWLSVVPGALAAIVGPENEPDWTDETPGAATAPASDPAPEPVNPVASPADEPNAGSGTGGVTAPEAPLSVADPPAPTGAAQEGAQTLPAPTDDVAAS